jgi:energy-coupling factor transporter transmembrane protein EcfT
MYTLIDNAITVFVELFWFFILFNFIIAAFIMYDQRINGRSGIGWAALMVLTGIIGLLIYWVVSSDTDKLAARRHKQTNAGERAVSYSNMAKGLPRGLGALSKPPVPNVEEKEKPAVFDETLATFMKFKDYPQAKRHIEKMIKLTQKQGEWETRQKYVELRDDLDIAGMEWLDNV